ncbi:MAG TPA: type II toxin-antitoxin system RelE/ParE family toxin [Burkholderiales bacterium]|nr:type II toxin-antitoxin system RelE/ParE family toxin [Burkholderiales bacterium]
MRFEVRLAPDALADLEEIHDWIALNDSPAGAAHVEDEILAVIARLARYPYRGTHPKELLALGIREYRETSFKPYRILYSVAGRHVDVYLIADGRRDMQALLARRLLEG